MPPPLPPKKESRNQVDGQQIWDAIEDRTKRKRLEGNGIQHEGRTMTVAESAMVSEEEYEDYRRNKMARSDDPLLAMQKMEGAV